MTNTPKRYEKIFWIEVDKIRPNPMQPRHFFDDEKLATLTDSIRQYGVLQPLVVNRVEIETSSGSTVEYELVAGERRWRASRAAGLTQVPVVIRDDHEDKIKLELSIIENLQREDLNPIERAFAFKKLIEQFKLRHHEVGERVGKSREYVSNTMRLLNLPKQIQDAVITGQVTEGHCRPILMISDKEEEQVKFLQDILREKMSVRRAERLSRNVIAERTRKFLPEDSQYRIETANDPEAAVWERGLANAFNGVARIERGEEGGKVLINFASEDDMKQFFEQVLAAKNGIANQVGVVVDTREQNLPQNLNAENLEEIAKAADEIVDAIMEEPAEKQQEEENYSVFTEDATFCN